MVDWQGQDGALSAAVEEQNRRLFDTYRADPDRVVQDANIERSIAEGAYAKRQVFELVQNASDAIRDDRGRCSVVLTSSKLYVANTGEPFTPQGVTSLMASHHSVKRDDRIGRFGLGFKSVLAVTDSPVVYSRTGSFAFDRQWAAELFRKEFPGHQRYPIMRIARPLEPRAHFDTDSVLQELSKWATTIVEVPIVRKRDVLAKSVRQFPAEFLLFSRHVARLDLEDRASGDMRRAVVEEDADEILLLDDAGRRSKWLVMTTTHAPSAAARLDGGYQADRDVIEVSWAAPVEGASRGVGEFWAYFPTADRTTLSGVVNAPWKLADDRESLLGGTFNDEILTAVLPSLVVRALPKLFSPERPAVPIDVLPARGKESRSGADDVINVPIMKAVSAVSSIPSLGGTLRHPTRIRLHPEGLEADELALWRSAVHDPEWWVHHGLNSIERRAKIVRLMGMHQRAAVGVREWVEHLVKEPTVARSAAAVKIIAKLIGRRPELHAELTNARVLLLEDGTLHACKRGQVFLPGGQREVDRLFIDPVLAGDPEVESALHTLGIELLDDQGSLRGDLHANPINWDSVWSRSRRLPRDEAERTFRDFFGDSLLAELRVRVLSGAWKRAGQVFLAGPIVPGDGSRDKDHVIHPTFHHQDIDLLSLLGMVREPRPMHPTPTQEAWRAGAEDRVREAVRKQPGQSRLPDSAIEIDTGRVPWPLEPLKELSPEGRAELTRVVLGHYFGGETWRVRVAGKRSSQTVPDPVWWHLRRHGYLSTQVGPWPVAGCLIPDYDYAMVDGVEQPLPVVTLGLDEQSVGALRLKGEIGDLRGEDWEELIAMCRPWDMPRRVLVYAWAALAGHDAPGAIRAERGRGHADVPPDEVAVTSSEQIYRSLVAADQPALLATPSDAETLMENWGLADGSEILVETVEHEAAGETYVLVDRYPPLRNIIDLDDHDLEVVPCSRLELLTSTPSGQVSRSLSEKVVGRQLFTTATQDRDVLLSVGRELNIRILPDTVLRRMEEQRRDKLRVQIAQTDDLLAKLVMAIGSTALTENLPKAALAALEDEQGRNLDDRELAKLALSVDGYGVLQQHHRALRENNLEPPAQWAGRRAAREWVRALGFPIEFAGFPGSTRDAELTIEGPPVLGELHDYQASVGERIRELLHPDAETRRGLVALPTGAGKTRVAVQALVEHMARQRGNVRVMWIAERDELCEQAVQTWSEVWRAKGGLATPLALSRLWQQNEAEERDGKQVVVASTAKLDTILRRAGGVLPPEYEWLKNPTIIVVDEAHRSIGPQYSSVLSAIGGANRVADMTTPLLGLTATPFRGWNDDETGVLAGRYHKNRLDDGVFDGGDVYAHLQGMGVLARVRQVRLEGTSVTLTDKELSELKDWRNSLPATVESRIGQDEGRNNRIVRSILELPRESKVLLFATSVENARTLAALLSFHGVEARSVSGSTDPSVRRRYINDFKDGSVTVLTNYNVFTEGFDVPTVDAVYITRPTFSPNVYQQMIGRGLRGPANGGKEEVLVVNVDDNLTNFGEVFAFRHFDHLWGSGPS